jgi:hypothetical protein
MDAAVVTQRRPRLAERTLVDLRLAWGHAEACFARGAIAAAGALKAPEPVAAARVTVFALAGGLALADAVRQHSPGEAAASHHAHVRRRLAALRLQKWTLVDTTPTPPDT